jgi:hypothetical protein
MLTRSITQCCGIHCHALKDSKFGDEVGTIERTAFWNCHALILPSCTSHKNRLVIDKTSNKQHVILSNLGSRLHFCSASLLFSSGISKKLGNLFGADSSTLLCDPKELMLRSLAN